MLRSGAPRSVLRTINTNAALRATNNPFCKQFASQIWTASRRPQLAQVTTALIATRTASNITEKVKSALPDIDIKKEAQIAKDKLRVDPETVSTTSSTHPLMSEIATPEKEEDTDMMAGVKNDLRTIKETFSLDEVPRQAFYLGLAGLVPYVATSLSTVYCAWEINHVHETGTGLLMSDKTAELALHVLEPLQIGYGATIISFLGAIHWGLEWAGYGGTHGYPRYMIGVAGAALAWPTILLPVEYALISQFLLFNFLYYTDSRATKRGWAPAWYGVYRFVLTFVVGASIVISLIGRGQISHKITKLPSATDRIKALRSSQDDGFESEEEARRRYLKSDDDEEEVEEDDD
nr:hypothetical protein B0A51_15891 [Rachicladosporium sp. CCFEE 5018]